MDLGMGKIRQSAAMVEVHVRENDMPHSLGTKTQTLDLPDRRFLGVHRNMRDHLEQAYDRGWVGVILQAGSRVDEHQALRGLNQAADSAGLQPGWPACVAGKDIESVDRHLILKGPLFRQGSCGQTQIDDKRT